MTGSMISRVAGRDGLPLNTVNLEFTGSAGNSFGAFTTHGMTLTLKGDANDYVGKGLSGARIIIRPSDNDQAEGLPTMSSPETFWASVVSTARCSSADPSESASVCVTPVSPQSWKASETTVANT